MSVVTRLGDATAGCARALRRQAHRARLRVERRRLESKVRAELAALGEELYAPLEAGELHVDAPGVPDRIAEIARLRSKIDDLGRTEELATRVSESIADTDYNASPEASAEQVLDDAADHKAGSPADQGGEG